MYAIRHYYFDNRCDEFRVAKILSTTSRPDNSRGDRYKILIGGRYETYGDDCNMVLFSEDINWLTTKAAEMRANLISNIQGN